jgi:hypothetical protein
MENLTYDEFINNILETRGSFACGDEYHERHHIMPKCLGGTDDEENLIDLFAREHFEAHRLLALENPDNNKLVYAWWMLAHIDGREITAEEYEEAKVAFSKTQIGKVMSEESRQKMRDNHADVKGQKHPMYGKPVSDIRREKQRKAMIGRVASNETRQKQSTAHKHENNARARTIIRLSDEVLYEYIGRAAKENNMHRTTMIRRCQMRNGFMYYDEYEILKESDMNLLLEYINNSNYDNSNGARGLKNPNARSVIQLTMDDVFVQKWDYMGQASIRLGIDYTGIIKCVNGDQRSAGGFHWKSEEDWEEIQGAKNINVKN